MTSICDLYGLPKSFRQVDHFVLSLLKILESHLLNAKQFVAFNDFESSTFTPASGVPEGSDLSSLLLNIFIDDLFN